MGMAVRRCGLLVVLTALVFAGCAAHKKGVGGAGSGLTEEGLAPGGSLAQYKSGGALPATETGPLQDIHFAFDSFELTDPSKGALQANANWLKENPRARVEIEGHCDERGTIEYNLALGAKRARAAKDYLTALGVQSDRLTTISYGEELPLCYEHNETCWAKNRRVHFVLLKE